MAPLRRRNGSVSSRGVIICKDRPREPLCAATERRRRPGGTGPAREARPTLSTETASTTVRIIAQGINRAALRRGGDADHVEARESPRRPSAPSKKNSITSQISAITSTYTWAAATPPRRRHKARKSPSGPAGVRDSFNYYTQGAARRI